LSSPARARLEGKHALITGGGGGIGAAAAEIFCEQGAAVLVVDRDSDALRATAEAVRRKVPGARVEARQTDITALDDARAAVAAARETFGGLSVLVNNAAVRYTSPVADADPAEWEKVLATNLLGALNCCKAALPALRQNGNASIINVSSAWAFRSRAGFGAYDASKAGLLALTRTLAHEEAQHGVRVNALCPGSTLTPFTIKRWAARGRSEQELRTERKDDCLLRRWAEPREIAYPILWLASDEASYITGSTLMVDAGQSIA
jgi:2-hydroxycyclohexanecarboxyl-CoA dehydrogenase